MPMVGLGILPFPIDSIPLKDSFSGRIEYLVEENSINKVMIKKQKNNRKNNIYFIMEALIVLALVLGSFAVLVGLSCCIFGFRPIGVAAGSCAACCQSVIGNVVKGSCFAIATCLAMRGCFIALIIVGLLVLVGVGIYLLIN